MALVAGVRWLDVESSRAANECPSTAKQKSGNDIYYTACPLLVILEKPCGKLHCQVFSRLEVLPYKISLVAGVRSVDVETSRAPQELSSEHGTSKTVKASF